MDNALLFTEKTAWKGYGWSLEQLGEGRGGADTDGGLPAVGDWVQADLNRNLLGQWGWWSSHRCQYHLKRVTAVNRKAMETLELNYITWVHAKILCFLPLPIQIVTGQAEAYNVSTNDCIAFKTFLLKRNNKIK